MSLVEIIFLTTFSILLVGFSVCSLSIVYFSRKPRRVDKKRIFPSVSMIIATYNEENVIARKLVNTAALEYPREKLQILIVDSGSTDSTREIVNDFIQTVHGSLNIELLSQKERMGKTSALNYAMEHCSGDIVILTDADVIIDKDAILLVTSNFNDQRIGAVSGIEVMRNPDQSGTTQMEQGYRSFYNTLRIGESNLDSVVMCESEFSAYRRSLMEPIPAKSICDDMELTLRIRKKGFRTIYDDNVFFYENSPTGYESRLRHKIRRGQGNQQTLIRFAPMMFTPELGAFSFVILPFEFFMHIVTPILTPICILSYILMTILSFNLFTVLLPAVLLAAIALLTYLFLKFISPATHVTLKNSANRADFRILLSVFDLITMQLVLFISLLLLILRGPDYKWEKINEVREVSQNSSASSSKRSGIQ